MPIYEYQCAKCGEFEVMQRISDSPLKKCPTCRGKVRKLMSNTSFQLKGSGWYITDYARGGKGGEGGAKASEAKADTSSGSESTSDSKSESKSESKAEKSAPKSDSGTKGEKKSTAKSAA